MYTVLFVDDNRNVRQYCRAELEREGYRVLLASDGREALDILHRVIPDLVILDVRMSGMGGLETTERIVAQDLGIPVILYSSRFDCLDDPRHRLATACVEKTEDLRELKAKVNGLLCASS
jgi:CheY-like chemotaxis protein